MSLRQKNDEQLKGRSRKYGFAPDPSQNARRIILPQLGDHRNNLFSKNYDFFKKSLDETLFLCYINRAFRAGVAQLVEQLICNQQVGGSSPSTSSNFFFNLIWECSRVAKGGRL